jgi:hypothetical protein
MAAQTTAGGNLPIQNTPVTAEDWAKNPSETTMRAIATLLRKKEQMPLVDKDNSNGLPAEFALIQNNDNRRAHHTFPNLGTQTGRLIHLRINSTAGHLLRKNHQELAYTLPEDKFRKYEGKFQGNGGGPPLSSKVTAEVPSSSRRALTKAKTLQAPQEAPPSRITAYTSRSKHTSSNKPRTSSRCKPTSTASSATEGHFCHRRCRH